MTAIRVMRFKSALLSVAEFRIKDEPVVVQPVSLTYSRVDGVLIGRHLRPYYAWYGDMDLVSHAADMIGLGRLTVTVSFHEPVTIDQFASRKELTEYCRDQIESGHSDALSGRIQPMAGTVGRWDWIRWRLRPRLRDMKGCGAPRRALPVRVRSAPGVGLTPAHLRLRGEIVHE